MRLSSSSGFIVAAAGLAAEVAGLADVLLGRAAGFEELQGWVGELVGVRGF